MSYQDYGISIESNKTKGEVDCVCPKCSADRKKQNLKPLRVNLDKSTWYCHHCGWTGYLPKDNFIPQSAPKSYTRPVWKNKTELSDRLIKWFESRKISQSALVKMKITEEMVWLPQTKCERNCVVFNYFRNGELINYKARDGEKNFALAKDAELIFYNIDSLINAKEAFIVEGEIDTLTLIQCGIQREGTAVIGVPNGANLNKNNLQYVDNCIELFDNIDKIYIGTDNDIAGRKLREDLAERFGKERCYYIDYKDKKDSNEVLISYGIDGVIECCSDKKEFPLEGVFTISHFSDDIDDMYINGMDRGCALGMGRIDELIRFAKGYITVITGVPNHGKSDALDQIILKLMVSHDWRVGFYSPENRPTKLHFSKLARKLIGKNWFGGNRMSEAEKNLVKTYLEGKVWFIKPEKEFTIESILSHAKLLKTRKGIDCFVIDAWNRLEHKFGKSNETTYVNETLLKIDGFCEANNMHCFLVVHPAKQQKDKKTGQIEVPNLYSLHGSAHFYNIIANGITVYRDFARDITTWYIQKVKFSHWGEIGHCDFKYDKECGRYNQYVIDPNIKNTEDKSNWITSPQTQQKIEIPEIITTSEEEYPF
jgi:twinkle protein